jgi:hypothetical protein
MPQSATPNVVWEGSVETNGVTRQARIIDTNGVYEVELRGGHQNQPSGAKEEYAASPTAIPYESLSPKIEDQTLLERLSNDGLISGIPPRTGRSMGTTGR